MQFPGAFSGIENVPVERSSGLCGSEEEDARMALFGLADLLVAESAWGMGRKGQTPHQETGTANETVKSQWLTPWISPLLQLVRRSLLSSEASAKEDGEGGYSSVLLSM